jgi:hypothetical protein
VLWVISGTPRVQGYPTPHKRHGRRRGQAVKAGQGPPRSRGAQAAFTAWHRCCTLATKEGWGSCARAGQAVGLRGDAPASRDLWTAEQAQHGPATPTPAPGWREPPRGADGPQPGAAGRASARPAGVGGGQHHGLRGTRLTRTLCGDGSSRDRTDQLTAGVWLLATACRAMGHTRRASGRKT